MGPLRRIEVPISDRELERFRQQLADELGLKKEQVITFNIHFDTRGNPVTAGTIRDDKTNVLPSQRIGVEEKQKYRDHLIEARVGEFLTQEEYDERVKRLDTAITQEQADDMLKDLKNVPLLTVKKEEPAQSPRAVKLTQMGLATGIIGLMASSSMMSGQWLTVAVLAIVWVVAMAMLS